MTKLGRTPARWAAALALTLACVWPSEGTAAPPDEAELDVEVFDTHGDPASGVLVILEPDEGQELMAATDSEGQRRITGLAPGHYRVRVVHGAHEVEGELTLEPGSRERLRVKMGRSGLAGERSTGVIRGEAQDALSGLPLAGVTLRLSCDCLSEDQVAKTDARGRFGFGELGPGEYTLELELGDRSLTRTLTLEATEQRRVELRVETGEQPCLQLGRASASAGPSSRIELEVVPERRDRGCGPAREPTNEAQRPGLGALALTGWERRRAVALGLASSGWIRRPLASDRLALARSDLDGLRADDPLGGPGMLVLPTSWFDSLGWSEGGGGPELGFAGLPMLLGEHLRATERWSGEVGLWVGPRLAPARWAEASDELIRVRVAPQGSAGLHLLAHGPLVARRLSLVLGVVARGELAHADQRLVAGTKELAHERWAMPALELAGLVGLDWQITADHELSLLAFGGPRLRRTNLRLPQVEPTTFASPAAALDWPLLGERVAAGLLDDGFATDLASQASTGLRYRGRMLDDRLELDLGLAHTWSRAERAWRVDEPLLRTSPRLELQSGQGRDLATIDGVVLPEPVVEACEPSDTCRARRGWFGGLGPSGNDRARRLDAHLGVAHYFEGAGSHRLRWGGELSWLTWSTVQRYSGGNPPSFADYACGAGEVGLGEACWDPFAGSYRTPAEPGQVANQRTLLLDPDGQHQPSELLTRGHAALARELDERAPILDASGEGIRAAAWSATLERQDYALFVGDRWALLPNLQLDLGLRWEISALRETSGTAGILLADQFAPRLGLAYDWTGEGRSRMVIAYGWYTRPLPLAIAARVLAGVAEVGRTLDPHGCVERSPLGQPTGSCVDEPRYTTGRHVGVVVPRLRGALDRQLELGYEHELAEGLIIGLRWLHRDLGRTIEELSPTLGLDVALANPGRPVRDAELAAKRRECDQLAQPSDDPRAEETYERCRFELAAWEQTGEMPKPTQTLDVWSVELVRELGQGFSARAHYAFSRFVGNWEGWTDARAGVISEASLLRWDIPVLVRNNFGPLAGVPPHRLELAAAYDLSLPRGAGVLSFAPSFVLMSGAPIDVRGDLPFDRYRGHNLVQLVPRGAAGRLPPLARLDLAVAYAVALGNTTLSVRVAVYNLVNTRVPVRVDEVYTFDSARPIAGGGLDDLRHAKRWVPDAPDRFFSRALIDPQRMFLRPTSFQQPLAGELALALRF